MPFNIQIDHIATEPNSDRSHSGRSGHSDHSDHLDHSDHSDRTGSSCSDEGSQGTGVRVSSQQSAVESQHYSDQAGEEGSWGHIYPDEIGPSDSASRPRTSNQHRPAAPEAPRANPVRRRVSRREVPHERLPHRPRPRPRAPPLDPGPESVDSYEEWPAGYVRAPPQHPQLPHARTYSHWSPIAVNPPGSYPHNYSPAPSYGPYPQNAAVSPQGALVPFASPAAQYPVSPYQIAGPGLHGYFPPTHHGAPTAHGGSPYSGQELMHHNPATGYFPYPQSYPVPTPVPTPVYPQYTVYTTPPAPPQAAPEKPAPAQTSEPTPPPPSETPKHDEQFARLEKILLDERQDREAREAAAKQAAEEAAAKAAADKQRAEEIAAASSAAAAAATKEAEAKAAEDAAKAKEAADAEREKAVADAAPPPPPPPPPEEKKKPIKFKDAVGRKFQFPWHLCNTWLGMEELIRQAFLHVEVIGPHVAEGHYDLVGPTGEIILPQVWETVVEPDWTITMHMWPMPEPPPPDPPAVEVPEAPPPPPAPGPSTGKAAKAAKPGGFTTWLMGGRPKPVKPKPKAKKA